MSARALWAMFRMGAKKVLAERAVLAGQTVVYCVLVSAYGVFFRGVPPQTLVRFGLTVSQLIWYIAVTQIVIGCTALHWRDMERDITGGNLDIPLTRPVAFWKLSLAEWFGQYVVRVLIIAPFGFLAAWYISGELLMHSLLPVLAILLCLFLAGFLFLCLHCLVGCAALWASPAEPVYRVWQKALFLVGARSSPLLLYPAWSQVLVWLTPFPSMLAVPGNIVIDRSATHLGPQIAMQLGWIFVGLLSVSAVANMVRRRLMREG